MNNRELVMPQDVDLTNCDRESIHTPGSIQPHGILLALDESKFTILQASKNTLDFLGLRAEYLIDKSLEILLDRHQIQLLKNCLRPDNLHLSNPLKLFINIKDKEMVFDSIVHRNQGVLILELEPTTYESNLSFLSFYNLVRTSAFKIQTAETFQELIEFVVKEIRQISNFDRVMVYQFDADANGAVIAEDKAEYLESFLGLHYPASDIPQQARQLYYANWLRIIVDVNYQPVEIISSHNAIRNQPLDLSFSVLRSVSPIHIEYLKNMGVRGSMSISLIKEKRLWGLIACHHYSPKHVPYDVRKACEFLGQLMSVELVYKEEQEDREYYRDKLKAIKNNLVNNIFQEKPIVESLLKEEFSLLDLVKAQGAVVSLGDEINLIGKTPSLEAVHSLITWLESYCHQDVFYTDSLSKLYPEFESLKDVVSGLLAISLSPTQSSYQVIWFRPEVIQTVNWAGNPNKPVEIQPDGSLSLSPRKSFQLWQETVRLKSLPWKTQEIEAALELRNALMLAALEFSQKELRQSKELAQVTLQSIGEAVITTNASGYIESLNPVAEHLTGWSAQQAKGLPLKDVFHIVNSKTRVLLNSPVNQVLQQGYVASLGNQTMLIAADGSERIINSSAAPIRNKDGIIIGVVLVFRDITKERSLANQLSWQTRHDALTGLVNRREFESCVEQALTLAKNLSGQYALCYLDLDQFKIINDTCGHAAGDELLRQISTLLQNQVHHQNTLGRLGGDEFGVLLYQCSLAQAQEIAEYLCQLIQDFRFIWADKTFTLGVSIGVVEIDAKTSDIGSILSAADAACYLAKNQGRNRVHIYQADDSELIRQRGEMYWATQIPQALEENRFCLYYQPIVALNQSTEVIHRLSINPKHCEVLLRLRDASGQCIPPMAFIPAAERYNLMGRIDRWVIRTIFSHLQQYLRLQSESKQTLQACGVYAVNLSGASINDDQFVKFLYEQFATYQIPPSMICFEITETLAIANLNKAVQFIRSLKALGCYFSLDDFGSGMSSFAYLQNLPVDYIKIDGGFVKEMMDNPIAQEIVEAIHRIGNVMQVKTIAEFVENDLILEKLKTIGVNYAQGYGIAQPRPLILP